MVIERIWREKKEPDAVRPGAEFSLEARTDNLKRRLEWAMKLSCQLEELSTEYTRNGFSTGGFSASIATASGAANGPPKTDPVTVNVADSAGNPMFVVSLLSDNGSLRATVESGNPAIREKLDRLPGDKYYDPFDRIRCVIAALTPEAEIGAAVATVVQGKLVFGSGGVDPATRTQIEQDRKNLAKAATDARDRAAVEGATVLQSPTTVGGPLRLKAPRTTG